jgi:hypothetical protein
MSEGMRHDLQQWLGRRRCHFMSVLADGGTDSGVIENELVFVQFVEQGKPIHQFIGIQPPTNVKAPGIKAAIETACERVYQEWRQKTVTIGTDGASVMSGHVAGVATHTQR